MKQTINARSPDYTAHIASGIWFGMHPAGKLAGKNATWRFFSVLADLRWVKTAVREISS
jgi:hypothetical protein